MTKVFSLWKSLDSCPNPDCLWHNPQRIPQGMKWYRNHGYYDSEQHGKVPRFICTRCQKSFSLRTENSDRYLHYDNIDISEVGKAWLAGDTLKEIARDYGISVSMVRTRLRRYCTDNDIADCP